MKKLLMLSTFIVLILLAGCGDRKIGYAESANSESATKPTRIIVVGIDESGSYELWNPVKKTIMSLIRQLEPGDILYLRRINAASYLDTCTIFRLEIPKISEPENANAFDRKAKIHRASLINRINSLKKEACQRVSDAEFKNSKYTDIYGFLAAAGDRFSLAPKACQRILLVASDLKDNVGHKAKYDLTDAYVAVIGFQSSKSPAETRKHKSIWTQKFTTAGAQKVFFLAVEEKFSVNLFKE
jgi:hypothetical protein